MNKKRKVSEKELEKFYIKMESRIRELADELHKITGNRVSKKKILIVDDDLKIQKLLTNMLSEHQYETEVTADGFEAGLKVMEFKPDIIILDLLMPRMDGFELCKRIKEKTDTAHIKILAITGYDTKENRERITMAGADEYMAKPLDTSAFLQHVEVLLKNKADKLKRI